MPPRSRLRSWRLPLAVSLLAACLGLVATDTTTAQTPVHEILSTVHTAAGPVFTATNHLLSDNNPAAGEYLVVWAGDVNVGDNTTNALVDRATTIGLNLERLKNVELPDLAPGNDFLAVIDADPTSSQYGRVVNTVTLSPVPENEPHHMQYVWHKGNRIYAGGLYTDTTYVFDVDALPVVKLTGVNLPTDTPCGSVPDAYWVLEDGTAYGTYMGGPDIPGPCLYTNGETRIGNGFAGSPGSLVRIGTDGQTLAEVPADTDTPVDRDPVRCPGIPTVVPTCANPHGIQVREDLDVAVTSDYAEPKNVPIADPLQPVDAHIFRDTVRLWDISDRSNPKVANVSAMPDGPRRERNPGHEEPRGIMEVTVTNRPQHRGAFAESMCGGVIYYTPDITSRAPVWREVFDDTAAATRINPRVGEGGGCDGGGWVQTSGDDRYLYHAVIGRGPGSLGAQDTGSAKMVYVLDVRKLLASGTSPSCSIDAISEVATGGQEADCPTLVDVLEVPDTTSGGPHWGALDNFARRADGTYSETATESRIAVSNYFVSRSGVDGNHKVCMVDIAGDGSLAFDDRFLDEHEGTPCVDFNRTAWPHGDTGGAKPHSQLFVVRNDRITTAPPPARVTGAAAPAAKATVTAAAPAPGPAPGTPPPTAAPALPASLAASQRRPARTPPAPLAGLAVVLAAGVGLASLATGWSTRRRRA
ncbi:MAG TPA: hypothetical protein VHM89_13640 [Acidimicrobiales bacterium]|nr:hypothetical protein [Acidimicrobiales bacterium]